MICNFLGAPPGEPAYKLITEKYKDDKDVQKMWKEYQQGVSSTESLVVTTFYENCFSCRLIVTHHRLLLNIYSLILDMPILYCEYNSFSKIDHISRDGSTRKGAIPSQRLWSYERRDRGD